MPIEPENRIAEIISAAGGKLVSKIRLQKIVYLLDQINDEHNFDFVYYHFGPFSRDVENAVLDGEAFGLIKEEEAFRSSDGAKYSIFTVSEPVEDYKFLHTKELKDLTNNLANENVTVLELAATAHWLFTYENISDWETEIRRRKGSKNDSGRLEKAKQLLLKISLHPAFEAGRSAH
ncbi:MULTISPECIES: hypothetical protein [unclassified Rhizobium]|uniref:hypothetical protein n=1 Tax=unclassified Rhizobium TaxID=2613769 RepID=UPI002889A2EA|nr:MULTISPECIES: hypothetical protein [unclassified Rhizobium]